MTHTASTLVIFGNLKHLRERHFGLWGLLLDLENNITLGQEEDAHGLAELEPETKQSSEETMQETIRKPWTWNAIAGLQRHLTLPKKNAGDFSVCASSAELSGSWPQKFSPTSPLDLCQLWYAVIKCVVPGGHQMSPNVTRLWASPSRFQANRSDIPEVSRFDAWWQTRRTNWFPSVSKSLKKGWWSKIPQMHSKANLMTLYKHQIYKVQRHANAWSIWLLYVIMCILCIHICAITDKRIKTVASVSFATQMSFSRSSLLCQTHCKFSQDQKKTGCQALHFGEANLLQTCNVSTFQSASASSKAQK